MKTWNSTLKSFTQLKLIKSPDNYFLLLCNNVCELLGTSYCIPKPWPMGPLRLGFSPLAQTSSYATGCFVFHFRYARGALSTTFSSYRAATLSPNIQGCKCPFAPCGRPNLQYTVRFGYTTFRSGRFRHGTFRSRNFCIFGTDEIC